MALTDKLTAIGNAVRTKNSQSGERTLPLLETDILSLKSSPNETIPDYIYTEAKRLAAVVRSRQTANSVSFICCSDLHEDGSATVSKHNAMAAHLVRKYAPIDFGVFLGDHIRAGSSDTEETSIAQYKSVLPQLAWWCDASVNGNHDNGMGWWDGYLSSDTLYQLIGRNAINVVRPSTEADRGYYYFDVPQKNFRVIMLNTNDLKDVAVKDHSVSGSYNDGHRVSVPQLQWFAQTLAAIPSGYKFIVCSHEPIHWFDYTYTDANGTTWDMAQKWRTILDAYAGGTSFSITQDGQTVSGDFSNNSNGVLIGTFHGHTHNFIDGKYGSNDIIRVGTPNACNSRTNTYGGTGYNEDFRSKYGELDSSGNQVTAYYKTSAGTTNETAFVVNTIDFENQIIYSDHYGAGRDRAISFGETTVYSITNNMSEHCSTNNSAAIAESGSSYTATITADTNYSVNVVVTMGGVDITSSAYNSSTGVISIPDVTGDITITATASISNYVPIVGYTDDSRWSTSTGNISSSSGTTAVNEIPIDSYPATFKLSGIDWSANNKCTFVALNADKELMMGTYLNNARTSSSLDIIHDGNGEVTLNIYAPSGYKYFKVSGVGLGADASIKVV